MTVAPGGSRRNPTGRPPEAVTANDERVVFARTTPRLPHSRRRAFIMIAVGAARRFDEALPRSARVRRGAQFRVPELGRRPLPRRNETVMNQLILVQRSLPSRVDPHELSVYGLFRSRDESRAFVPRSLRTSPSLPRRSPRTVDVRGHSRAIADNCNRTSTDKHEHCTNKH